MQLKGLFIALLVGIASHATANAASTEHGGPHAAAIAPLAAEPPAKLIASQPLPEQLARGLVVITYRTENLRIEPVYGAAALDVSPRIGHIHVTVDGAPWHWADASNEPLIIQGLPPGPHKVLIELANPVHLVIDRKLVEFQIPATQSH
jgi:hypothetical protein